MRHSSNIETIANNWTLTKFDITYVRKYTSAYRLYIAIQLCAIRTYGKFLYNVNELSTEIINYISRQLNLPPVINVNTPKRKATIANQRQSILVYLGFQKFDDNTIIIFTSWIEDKAHAGYLPNELKPLAYQYLLENKIVCIRPRIPPIHSGTS